MAMPVIGTSGPDSLRGTEGEDVILGLAGRDTIEGLGGHDLLLGGAGADLVRGDFPGFEHTGTGGNDTILGGPGDDTLYGGSVSFGGPAGDGDNLILGGSGNDAIVAGWGADTVLGGRGDDQIRGFGEALGFSFRGAELLARADQADLLRGGPGNDGIYAGAGADSVFGGPGDDTLSGQLGADLLDGGSGADRFVMAPIILPFANSLIDTGVGEGQRDVILDFRQGEDVIDLSGYDSPDRFPFTRIGPERPEELPKPVFLGTGDFVPSLALQVRTEILPDGNTLVQFATPLGPRQPDPDTAPTVPPQPTGEIELVGTFCLTAQDFVLDYPLR
ncbi:calcium-binding protein [Paracraurococcus lichenis]|uniref:Calcium-binding protein n=1 Tax=Paracraurococcus lichenis TaxID=3064888 RepID=A0ABT9E0M9_9PROT|nr:calcium-binding protein [Paracraurococcus sp. LOR1-02]MDO9709560.1 calcium-binding protein [Paracraurococcus sp. LOR1-02]